MTIKCLKFHLKSTIVNAIFGQGGSLLRGGHLRRSLRIITENNLELRPEDCGFGKSHWPLLSWQHVCVDRGWELSRGRGGQQISQLRPQWRIWSCMFPDPGALLNTCNGPDHFYAPHKSFKTCVFVKNCQRRMKRRCVKKILWLCEVEKKKTTKTQFLRGISARADTLHLSYVLRYKECRGSRVELSEVEKKEE